MKAKKESSELKVFNMRLPKETWLFIKNSAAEKEMPMSEMIIGLIDKYRKKEESKLTYKNINV